MNKQRGSAFLLVLVALALGSMLITPTMQYIYTGLNETKISREQMIKQNTADSALEYALWQLKYNVDGITTDLSENNPSSTSVININGIEVPITTEISPSPESGDEQFVFPASQSGIHITAAMSILPPRWSKSGQKAYLTHMIVVYNYGTSAVHLKSIFESLHPDLMYVPGSFDGPSVTVTNTNAGDHWELLFGFDQPLPKIEPKQTLVFTFTAWTKKNMGDYEFSGSGWVEYAAFSETIQETYSGTSGPSSVGLYDITIEVGGYTLLVTMGITDTGDVVIRSYQIE
ncbi:MAG: hypothetical protein U1D67_01660 [Dehalococcoidia bacterium]|nr:hypothetical protein [Dehalococcoidia bacterium]